MYCTNCGCEITNAANFCNNCGHPVGVSPSQNKQQEHIQDNTVKADKKYNGVVGSVSGSGDISIAKAMIVVFQVLGTLLALFAPTVSGHDFKGDNLTGLLGWHLGKVEQWLDAVTQGLGKSATYVRIAAIILLIVVILGLLLTISKKMPRTGSFVCLFGYIGFLIAMIGIAEQYYGLVDLHTFGYVNLVLFGAAFVISLFVIKDGSMELVKEVFSMPPLGVTLAAIAGLLGLAVWSAYVFEHMNGLPNLIFTILTAAIILALLIILGVTKKRIVMYILFVITGVIPVFFWIFGKGVTNIGFFSILSFIMTLISVIIFHNYHKRNVAQNSVDG